MTTPSIPELMRLARDFEKQWDPLLRELARRLEQLEDDAYSPQASSGEFLLWCVTHDRRLDACEGEATVNPGFHTEFCVVGAEQGGSSPVSDPTGSTALATGNPKRADIRAVKRDLEALLRIVGHVDLLTALPKTIHGSKLATAVAGAENANASCCEVCAGHGSWVPPHTKNPTDVDGRLPKKQWLCRFHYGFVNTYGELPNDSEEAKHQAGQRVTRVVRQTDRLVRGLAEGKLT